jgi:hypothetical protein
MEAQSLAAQRYPRSIQNVGRSVNNQIQSVIWGFPLFCS